MRLLLITIFILALIPKSVFAQEDKFKAIFVYKFLQTIQWPTGKPIDKYLIGVVGSGAMKGELTALAAVKKVQSKDIVVEVYNAQKATQYHIIYETKDASQETEKLSQESVKNGSVLITEAPGLSSKGSFLNMIVSSGKIKFEMSRQRFADAKIKPSKELESLAVMVD
jgi:YfiR/HmsC-like